MNGTAKKKTLFVEIKGLKSGKETSMRHSKAAQTQH